METSVLAVVNVVLIAVAIWRYTRMLYRDNGPFHILDWMRHKFGVQITYIESPGSTQFVVERSGETVLGELFSCPYCLSFWVASAFVPYMLAQLGILNLPVWSDMVYSFVITFGSIWGIVTMLIIMAEERE